MGWHPPPDAPMGREARLSTGRKVVLGYPVGGSVTLPFHASCLRLLGYELGKPDARRLLSKITHTSGLYVGDNRTMLAQRFLSTSADWLLMIDTDIEFPATLLETMVGLAGDERKILAASVPLGAYASTAFMRTEKPGVWRAVYPVPSEPIPVDGIATACVLIHRDVLEGMAARLGQSWFHHIYLEREGGEYLSQGEDLAFSVRAAECGFKSWAVHVPGLGHYKTRRLSHDEGEETPGMGEEIPC